MTKTLPSTSWIARTALKIVKAVGPLSAEASEAFAQHQLRMAQVEACKELMLGEVRTYTEIRRKLAERLYETPEGDRFRVKRDLEYLNGEILCLGVYQKALDYLPKYSEQPNAPSAPERDISPSWLDRFNELARLHNEPWREDLLSRALAWEAENPGSVSPRALWFIGTVDELIFHAFAALIDTCATISGRYMIPQHGNFYERAIPNCALGDDLMLGSITLLLTDLGLMGDLNTSQRILAADSKYPVRFGSKCYGIKPRIRFPVSGIVLTTLGDLIASLYEPKPNDLGMEIFDAWIKSIRPEVAEVQPEPC